MLKKLSISLFSLLLSFSFIQSSHSQTLLNYGNNTCSQTYYELPLTVVTQADLTVKNYTICVNDGDSGQNVNVSGLGSRPSGLGITFNYTETFPGIGSYTRTFTGNDGIANSSIATLVVNITAASITYSNTASSGGSLANGGSLNYGDTVTVTCTNSTGMSVSPSSSSFSSSVNGNTVTGTFKNASSQLLDNKTYTVTCSNIGGPQGGFSFLAKAKPITVTSVDQFGSSLKDNNVTWSSDAGECEVKWNDGANSQSFSPAVTVSKSSSNPNRDLVSWSATVPTKNLGDGVYGYQVSCTDNAHPDRLPQPATTLLKLTLSSGPITMINVDPANPNYIKWKCINSTSASLSASPADSANTFSNKTTQPLSGSFIKKDGISYTLTCNGKDINGNPASDTKIYNPSTLSLSQGNSNSSPYVDIVYTCPAGTARGELYRDGIKLPIQYYSGSYKDTGLITNNTYTYKLYCYDSSNSLIAYSEKSIKLDGSSNSQDCNTTNTCGTANTGPNCSYTASTGSVNCSSIPSCTTGAYASQTNNRTDGTNQSPNPITSSGSSSFSFDSNVYQYKFSCANTQGVCPSGLTLNKNNNTCEKTVKAVTPPYTHFISFNVSSGRIQSGAGVNLNWTAQNPNTSCNIKAYNISDNAEVTNTTSLSSQNTSGSDLARSIKGQGVINTTTSNGGFITNGSTQITNLTKSTRFIASCTESGFAGTPLNGLHQIIKDVYVIGEKEQ